MGVYLARPHTEKDSDDGIGIHVKQFGVTSMQGWRQGMEDAHLAIPNFKDEMSIFGVFDGHGGAAVSRWVALNFESIFSSCYAASIADMEAKKLCLPPGFNEKAVTVCEALQRTFLELDVQMQTPENRQKLEELHNVAEISRQAVQEKCSDTGGGQWTPQMVLQTLLAGKAPGNRPLVRIVEQDGKQWVQLINEDESKEDESEQDHEHDHEKYDEDESPQKATVEEISGNDEEENAANADSASEQDPDIHMKPTIVEEPESSPRSPVAATTEAVQASIDMLLQSVGGNIEVMEHDSSEDDDDDEEDEKAEDTPEDTEDVDVKHEVLEDDNEEVEKHDEMEDGEKMEAHTPEYCGATAIVVAVIGGDDPMVIAANAGDSRAVLCRDGRAVALSDDHKPQQAHESDRIHKAGGSVINGRVDGNLNLSRSLGDLYYKRDATIPPEQQRITAFPDVRLINMTATDEFLVLACDGIWDCMDNDRVVKYVRRRLEGHSSDDAYTDSEVDPSSVGQTLVEKHSDICAEMCDRCLSSNPVQSEGIGCDNMTVMVVSLKASTNTAVDEVEVKLYPSLITPDIVE